MKTGLPGTSRNLSKQRRTPTVTNPTHIWPLVLAIRTLTPWVSQKNISCKSCNWISANCREKQYFFQCIWKTQEGRTVQCFANWQWGSIDGNPQWSMFSVQVISTFVIYILHIIMGKKMKIYLWSNSWYRKLNKKGDRMKISTTPNIRQSEFRNLGNFSVLVESEIQSWKSGIQFKESVIPLTIEFRNPSSNEEETAV